MTINISKNQKLVVLCGPRYSGKSRVAKRILKFCPIDKKVYIQEKAAKKKVKIKQKDFLLRSMREAIEEDNFIVFETDEVSCRDILAHLIVAKICEYEGDIIILKFMLDEERHMELLRNSRSREKYSEKRLKKDRQVFQQECLNEDIFVGPNIKQYVVRNPNNIKVWFDTNFAE